MRLSPSTEQELYRIAQEALNNVLQHTHATRAEVRLDVSADVVSLKIRDDGVGFVQKTPTLVALDSVACVSASRDWVACCTYKALPAKAPASRSTQTW